MNKKAIAITVAALWISASEFLRNELLFRDFWADRYDSLGLEFATTPVNGILWFLWSLLLAWVIYRLLRLTTLVQALAIAWVSAFVMMWITAYNLQVLPLWLLVAAVPLSLVEVAVAALIIRKVGAGT